MDPRSFTKLLQYLQKIPAMREPIHTGSDEDAWWVQFQIDIKHKTAWQLVQELGFVLNYISLNERLPTVFKPVSPPPYLNGGPGDFLSWIIGCDDLNFRPGSLADILEGRLPRPVDDLKHWEFDDDA